MKMHNPIKKIPRVFLHLFFIIATASWIVPFLLMVSISFSSEADVTRYGFALVPRTFSTEAYRTLFAEIGTMAWAALFTIMVSFGAAVLMNLFSALIAYPLSRPNCKFKGPVNKLLIFTMLFSGGTIPLYILNTRYLHLNNTPFIYLIPYVSAWSIILYRTFFRSVPESLYEAAKIDGATELRVLASVVVPMSRPIIFMQVFQNVVDGWNNWATSLLYVTKKSLWTIQYFMQMMLQYGTELKEIYRKNPAFAGKELPLETMRYAMAVIAVIPVLVIFPMIQKYFAKGINVGSVKG